MLVNLNLKIDNFEVAHVINVLRAASEKAAIDGYTGQSEYLKDITKKLVEQSSEQIKASV